MVIQAFIALSTMLNTMASMPTSALQNNGSTYPWVHQLLLHCGISCPDRTCLMSTKNLFHRSIRTFFSSTGRSGILRLTLVLEPCGGSLPRQPQSTYSHQDDGAGERLPKQRPRTPTFRSGTAVRTLQEVRLCVLAVLLPAFGPERSRTGLVGQVGKKRAVLRDVAKNIGPSTDDVSSGGSKGTIKTAILCE